MMAVQWIDPGPVGFAAGGVLIVCAVALLWLLFGARRVRAEVRAEVGAGPPPGYWHPSMGPQRRVEDATQLIARCSDELDATALIPRQRAVRRG